MRAKSNDVRAAKSGARLLDERQAHRLRSHGDIKPRGTCPQCGKDYSLTLDARMRIHRPYGYRCAGTGARPVEATS